MTLAALGCGIAACALGQDRAPARPGSPAPRPPGARSTGLTIATGAASPGYTLFAPLLATTTYLVDLRGQLVHSWPSAYQPGEDVHLLDDGSLLRAGRDPHNRHFVGRGSGGRVERIALDGTLVWQFVYADETHCQHHDIEPLPNGHVLLIAWEKKTRAEAIAAGLDPQVMTGAELWPDSLVEIEPLGSADARIVWEWHVWDHLVQDFDPHKPNYGEVVEHPELIDLNYHRAKPRETPTEIARLRSLGYLGGGAEEDDAPGPQSRPRPDGTDQAADRYHINSVEYNAQLDQIMVSVHSFGEIWIIDHSTTRQEAAGHVGGRYGHGGDLLYRFGNPWAYLAGGPEDQTLFAQHDARWIPDNMPGAGHVTVFNNGAGRLGGQYSSVVEFVLPLDPTGHYRRESGGAFVPPTTHCEYTAPNKTDFFASYLSGAKRLPNGNTLICSGEEARLFEVDPAGKTVWEYINPYREQPAAGSGSGRAGAGSGRTQRAQQPPHLRSSPPGGSPAPPGPSGLPGASGGGLFRATRYAPDHPGILRLLEARNAGKSTPD